MRRKAARSNNLQLFLLIAVALWLVMKGRGGRIIDMVIFALAIYFGFWYWKKKKSKSDERELREDIWNITQKKYGNKKANEIVKNVKREQERLKKTPWQRWVSIFERKG